MPASRVTSNSPWHIVLVLDDSGSMSGNPAQHLNDAVTAMVDEMKILSGGKKPYFKLSVVSFGSRPTVLCTAESEQTVALQNIASFGGNSGSTDAASALTEAADLLARNVGAPTDFTPYVFFLSDGVPDDERAALAAGDRLKSLSLAAGTPRVVTIGFGTVNDAFMEKLATTPELYKKLRDPREIINLFPNIGTIAASQASGTAGVDQAIMNL
jgi:uncharacterized protein YegL